MSRRLFLLAAVLLAAGQPQARADSWAPPSPRIYSNVWGTHGFKVVPEKGGFNGPTAATLFTLDEKGDEKPVWKGKLVNMPHQVFLSSNGKNVVTVDTYGSLGYKHAVVVYDDKGKPLADYALEDLLNAGELKEKVMQTAGSRHWAPGTQFTYADDGKTFNIQLKWGRLIKIDLATGKVQ